MIQRPIAAASLVLAMLAASCSTPPPDGQQKTPEGPQFDASYYAKNAKEYFDDGRYGQARDQWQKQLQKDPENWMARLGIAYCDLYLAEQVLAAGADLPGARRQAAASETGFRDLWGGHVEADTLLADPKRPQWKAAMGLAIATRTLGYLDQVDSRRAQEAAAKGGPDSNRLADRAAELQLDRDRRYLEAASIFRQLAYMEHASPEAIKHLGELYVVTKQDALAEAEFKRYLDLASRTREQLEAGRRDVAKQFGGQEEVAVGLFEEKLQSNAQKQVSVLKDLARLAWSRADYLNAREHLQKAIEVDPTDRDLYLQLAEVEARLEMYETALINVNEYLKRSSSTRTAFDSDIRVAMKLKQDVEAKLKERAPR
jgi:Flp pilus assembly protein TadD